MSLLSDLTDRLLAQLADKLAPIIGPVKGLFNLFTKFKDETLGVFQKGDALFEEVLSEYTKIRDFKSQPAWKNRVISVPRAIDNIQNLIQVPSQIVSAAKDLFAQFKGKFQTAEVPEIEDVEGLEDLTKLFKGLGGKIATGFEKALGFLAIVLDAIVTVNQVLDDLKTIVDDVKQVREDLENLDGLFLPQHNRRKTIQSDDGPIRLRIGKLHSNDSTT